MNVRNFGPALRGAGAEGKAILLQMAGEELHASAARLQVKGGVVTAPATPGKSVTYGQLVQGKRIERHIEGVPVKPVTAYTVAGRAAPRKDALDKVTGKARYSGDFTFPGMLHARLVRPPAHGAKFQDADTSAAEKAGARVVRDGELVAVLHERPDLADKALGLVKARFELPQPTMDDKTIFDHLLKAAPPLQNAGAGGDLAVGEKSSAVFVEATYLNSYVAHAPMETHSATAIVENGKATVWASTQAPFSVRQQVAQAVGLTPQNVRIRSECADGTPFGYRHRGERQGYRVGQHAGAVFRQAAGGAGRRSHAAKRSHRRFLCGRRFRREECRRTGGGGGASGQSHRQAGAGGVEPRRGILLRYLPPRGGGQDPFGTEQRRKDRALGLPGLRRGRAGGEDLLRCSEPAHAIGRRLAGREPSRDAPVRRGPVARAFRQHQLLRARIAHGCPGRQSRHRPAGVPPQAPLRCPHDSRAGGGCQTVRMEGRKGA